MFRASKLSLLLVFAIAVSYLPTAGAATVADGHAGFSVSIREPRQWVSQLTHVPGVTSKLCLRREVPAVLICIQSLLTPVGADEVPALADGFVTAIAERFGAAVPKSLAPMAFSELKGLGHRFEVPAEVAREGLTDVWLFAGRGARGQAQMVIAFTRGSERALGEVRATVDSLTYHANAR